MPSVFLSACCLMPDLSFGCSYQISESLAAKVGQVGQMVAQTLRTMLEMTK